MVKGTKVWGNEGGKEVERVGVGLEVKLTKCNSYLTGCMEGKSLARKALCEIKFDLPVRKSYLLIVTLHSSGFSRIINLLGKVSLIFHLIHYIQYIANLPRSSCCVSRRDSPSRPMGIVSTTTTAHSTLQAYIKIVAITPTTIWPERSVYRMLLNEDFICLRK